MEELAEGQALAGRYLLGPVVGHGAMGRVHLAEDLQLARPVAVKSLRPELARYADVRQRFGQEARAAARINHPSVVRVYDSGEEGSIPYLVMECLPGSTLGDELAWGPLDPRRARSVGLDVLGALDAAHRTGVVHRDVKPGNILLTAALDGPVKVADFGIAKSADDRSLTDSGALVGTAAYLAPERVAGGPATPASDVYSVGVVLYEALSGRKPYDGETPLAVALAIHMGGAPGLLELRPDLDPELAEVVDRALAADPAERWESAAAMAAPLRAGSLGGGAGRVAPSTEGRPARGSGRPVIGERGTGRPPVERAPTVAAPLAAATAAVAGASDEATVPLAPHDQPAGAGPAAARHRAPATVIGSASSAAAGARHSDQEAPDGGVPRPVAGRRPVLLALVAGAAVLVLLGGWATLSGGSEAPPAEPVTPTTASALVAGAATTTAPNSTAAPVRAVPSVTTATTRRPPAPTTTARPVPSTTTTGPAAPTTTRAPVTTTRPPPTAPPTTAPTTPGTDAPAPV